MTFSDCADTITPAYWLGRPGDLVQVNMPQENYDKIFDTFVVWARFGDLFSYDETTGMVSLQ